MRKALLKRCRTNIHPLTSKLANTHTPPLYWLRTLNFQQTAKYQLEKIVTRYCNRFFELAFSNKVSARPHQTLTRMMNWNALMQCTVSGCFWTPASLFIHAASACGGGRIWLLKGWQQTSGRSSMFSQISIICWSRSDCLWSMDLLIEVIIASTWWTAFGSST